MKYKEEIKEFFKSPAGQELLKELKVSVNNLDTVRNLDEHMSVKDIGIEQITNRKVISIIETWIGIIVDNLTYDAIETPKEEDIFERLEKTVKQ